jgi:hypothetical protein
LFKKNISETEVLETLNRLAEEEFNAKTLNGDAIIKILGKIGRGKTRRDLPRHVVYSGAPVISAFKDIRKTGVLSIENLIANSVMIESSPNTKQNKKTDVGMYHRFYAPMRVGGKSFCNQVSR